MAVYLSLLMVLLGTKMKVAGDERSGRGFTHYGSSPNLVTDGERPSFKNQQNDSRPHPIFPVPTWNMVGTEDGNESVCDINTNLWECLGSDRDWGLVSLIDKVGEDRLESIPRLLTRAKLMLVTLSKDSDLPMDFRLSGTIWEGRRSTQLSSFVLISGDLDDSEKLFNVVLSSLQKKSRRIDAYDLLPVATSIASGDILELGTDEVNTNLLHNLVKEENASNDGKGLRRMLVTADSSSAWLGVHSTLLCNYHQFVFVPLYNSGAGCKHIHQSGLDRRHREKMRNDKISKITCMHL